MGMLYLGKSPTSCILRYSKENYPSKHSLGSEVEYQAGSEAVSILC